MERRRIYVKLTKIARIIRNVKLEINTKQDQRLCRGEKESVQAAFLDCSYAHSFENLGNRFHARRSAMKNALLLTLRRVLQTVKYK